MMKKYILPAVLYMLLLFSQINVSSAAQPVKNEEYLNIVTALGLMENTDAARTITKAHAAKIAADIICKGNVPANTGSYYDDVLPDYWAYSEINFLSEAGYFKPGKMFYPDREASQKEIAELFVGILGCKDAELSGVKVDYVHMAGKTGLFKGVDTWPVTASDMARIIYNMLELPILTCNYDPENPVFVYNTDITFAETLDIEAVSGRLTATEDASVDGAKAPEGKVRINGALYTVSFELSRYVGTYVEAYAKNSDEKYPEVVYADFPSVEWVQIDADDIITVSSDSITYYEYKNGTGRETTAVISDDAAVIYNGSQVYGDKQSYIQPDTGTVFIASDGTDDYSVVYVLDYDVKVIAYVSASQDKIVCSAVSDNEIIDLSQYSETEVYRNGEKSSLDRLYPNDVIHLCSSADKERMRIYAADSSVVSGTLTEKSDNHIVVEGNQYRIRPGLFPDNGKDSLSIGDSADYYLDINGNIFAYSRDKLIDRIYYGYAFAVSNPGGFKKPQIKIFSETGRIYAFDFTDKIRFSDGYTTIKALPEEIIAGPYFKDSDGKTIDRLVKYTLTSDNKISSLSVPRTLDYEEGQKGYSSEFSTVLENSEENGVYIIYDRYGRKFNNKYTVAEDALVFSIPDNLDENKMMISNISDVLSGIADNSSTKDFGYVALYNSDEFLDVSIVVCKSASQVEASLAADAAIVEKVTRVMDSDGNEVTKLYYYQKGNRYESVFSSGFDLPDVEVGMMLQLRTDASGEINGCRVLYSPKNNKEYFVKSISTSGIREGIQAYWHGDCFVYHGNSYGRNSEATRMLVHTNHNWDEMRSMNIKSAYYYIFDTEKNKIIPASSEDLVCAESAPCEVVFRCYRSDVRDIIIIK